MNDNWIWDELELAAAQYAEIPEYLRPVITSGRVEAGTKEKTL
jgi:hypothetical protein